MLGRKHLSRSIRRDLGRRDRRRRDANVTPDGEIRKHIHEIQLRLNALEGMAVSGVSPRDLARARRALPTLSDGEWAAGLHFSPPHSSPVRALFRDVPDSNASDKTIDTIPSINTTVSLN